MKKEKVMRQLPDGAMFESYKMWDGYLTVSAKTARAISVTGKLPRHGYIVKTKYVFPAIGLLSASVAWLGWTTYEGETALYLH